MSETVFQFRYWRRSDLNSDDEFYQWEADFQNVPLGYVKAKYEAFNKLDPHLWDFAIAALHDVETGQIAPIPALAYPNISNEDKDAILAWIEANDEVDSRFGVAYEKSEYVESWQEKETQEFLASEGGSDTE